MATDLERLVVQLSADITRYERALQRAHGQTTKRAREIETRFARMNKNISSQASLLGAGITRAFALAGGARGAQMLIDSSTRITNALKVAGLEGTELASVYDSLFASAQKNAAPLETLVTLYGRAALVQKELGVSTEELLGFTDKVAMALRVAGTDAQSASGALLQLSQALGSGVVRAEEFNSILEGALPIAQAAAAGLDEAGGSVAKLRQLVVDGAVSSEAFFRAFEAGAVILEEKVAGAELTVSQGMVRLQNVLIDAAGKFDKATDTSGALAKALNELGDIVQALGGWFETVRQPIAELDGWFQRLTSSVNNAGKATGEFLGTNIIGRYLQGRDLDTGLTPAEYINQVFSAIQMPNTSAKGARGSSGQGSGAATVNTVSLSDFAPPSGKKAGGGGGGSREDAWAREIRQIQEATEALELEIKMIGQSELAKDKARAAQDLLNAARRAGVEITPDVMAKIDAEADRWAQASENLRTAEDRYKAIMDIQQEFGNIAIDGIMGLIDGTKSLNDILKDTLKTLTQMALKAAILGEGPLATLFGTSRSGGAGGGLLGMVRGLLPFSEGGYTGAGGKYEPAGVVHGGEYVFSKEAVQRAGVGNLERMHKSLRGYASGGLVAPSIKKLTGSGAAASGKPSVVVNADMRDSSANAIAVLSQRIDRLQQSLPDLIASSLRGQLRNDPYALG